MIVTLHQYRDGDAQPTVASDEQVVDQDATEYFDAEEIGPDEGWTQFEHDGRVIQHRVVTYEDVVEVSRPEDAEASGDLPGTTFQLIVDGRNEFVEDAQVVEVAEGAA